MKERELEIEDRLALLKQTEGVILVTELLALRRERHRDKLESSENEDVRGRAKECKDLIHILS